MVGEEIWVGVDRMCSTDPQWGSWCFCASCELTTKARDDAQYTLQYRTVQYIRLLKEANRWQASAERLTQK